MKFSVVFHELIQVADDIIFSIIWRTGINLLEEFSGMLPLENVWIFAPSESLDLLQVSLSLPYTIDPL
jgi:hypothetical protein